MSPVKTQDTAPEAERVQASVFRDMTPQERLLAAITMSEEAREITRAGIRFRNPTWTSVQVQRELLIRLYGEDLVAKVWDA